MSDGWITGLVLNAIVGTAFLTISLMLAVQLTRSRQWGANPIGSVFAILVGLCGAGHALRAVLGVGPVLGLFGTTGLAMQVTFADWHMWIPDALAAASGVFYVVGRIRDRDILETTRAFEDYRSRRQRAIEIHDTVVQNLLEAKLALERGERETAREALDEGTAASKAIASQRAPRAAGRSSTLEDAIQEGGE